MWREHTECGPDPVGDEYDLGSGGHDLDPGGPGHDGATTHVTERRGGVQSRRGERRDRGPGLRHGARILADITELTRRPRRRAGRVAGQPPVLLDQPRCGRHRGRRPGPRYSGACSRAAKLRHLHGAGRRQHLRHGLIFSAEQLLGTSPRRRPGANTRRARASTSSTRRKSSSTVTGSLRLDRQRVLSGRADKNRACRVPGRSATRVRRSRRARRRASRSRLRRLTTLDHPD